MNSDAALNFPGNPTANPNVVGAAYSNNVADALQTTLYDIDSVLDQLFTQGGSTFRRAPRHPTPASCCPWERSASTRAIS